MVLIENFGKILIISIIIIASALIILVIIEKKLYRKIIQGRNSRNVFYAKKIEDIKNTGAKNKLIILGQIARDFFAEAFGTKNTADYSKLENFFKQKNNLEIAEFCRIMNRALYSGGKINKEESQKIIPLLRVIVQKNHIFTQKEREELKKSQEPQKPGILDSLKKTLNISNRQNT